MLTYPCQSTIFQYLSFENRCLLAKNCPSLQNRHKKHPFFIINLEIAQFDGYFHLTIDNNHTWIYPGDSQTCISHQTEALDHWDSPSVTKVKCQVADVSERVLNWYLGRKGTVVINFSVKGKIDLSSLIPKFKVINLQVYSDETVSTWFHVAKGNEFRSVKIAGRSVIDLLDQEEIRKSKNITIATSSVDIQGLALEKLTTTNYLRFEFNSFLGRYHHLSEEIYKISLQNRPIGAVIDYFVHDYFNTKLYPNFAKIVADLKARRTNLDGINAITIPMRNSAELNVFMLPDKEDEPGKKTWTLRMAVMEMRN